MGTKVGVIVWVTLAISMPFFSIFFNYDVVGALGPLMQNYNLTDAEEVGFLYVSYGSLTPLTTLLFGYFVDRYGHQFAGSLALFLSALGATQQVFVVYYRDVLDHAAFMRLMLLGRVFVGFGEPALIVLLAQVGILFRGQWSTFVVAFSVVAGQIGNVFVFWGLPTIAKIDLTFAFGVGAALAVFSFLSNILYAGVDHCVDFESSMGKNKETSPMRISDVKEFPVTFWCLNFINMLSTISVFSLMSFSPLILVEEYDYTIEQAGFLVAMMNAVVIIAPVLGWALNIFGNRTPVWFLCCVLITTGIGILPFHLINPLYPLLIMSAAFALLNASVNSAVALVVKPQVLGTAFGVIGFCYTTSLLLYPLFIGIFRSTSGNWDLSLYFLGTSNIIGVICCLIAGLFDHTRALKRSVLTERLYTEVSSESDIRLKI